MMALCRRCLRKRKCGSWYERREKTQLFQRVPFLSRYGCADTDTETWNSGFNRYVFFLFIKHTRGRREDTRSWRSGPPGSVCGIRPRTPFLRCRCRRGREVVGRHISTRSGRLASNKDKRGKSMWQTLNKYFIATHLYMYLIYEGLSRSVLFQRDCRIF